jgi:hypothetical protein
VEEGETRRKSLIYGSKLRRKSMFYGAAKMIKDIHY